MVSVVVRLSRASLAPHPPCTRLHVDARVVDFVGRAVHLRDVEFFESGGLDGCAERFVLWRERLAVSAPGRVNFEHDVCARGDDVGVKVAAGDDAIHRWGFFGKFVHGLSAI